MEEFKKMSQVFDSFQPAYESVTGNPDDIILMDCIISLREYKQRNVRIPMNDFNVKLS